MEDNYKNNLVYLVIASFFIAVTSTFMFTNNVTEVYADKYEQDIEKVSDASKEEITDLRLDVLELEQDKEKLERKLYKAQSDNADLRFRLSGATLHIESTNK